MVWRSLESKHVDGNWCDLGTNRLKHTTLVGTDRVQTGIDTKRREIETHLTHEENINSWKTRNTNRNCLILHRC